MPSRSLANPLSSIDTTSDVTTISVPGDIYRTNDYLTYATNQTASRILDRNFIMWLKAMGFRGLAQTRALDLPDQKLRDVTWPFEGRLMADVIRDLEAGRIPDKRDWLMLTLCSTSGEVSFDMKPARRRSKAYINRLCVALQSLVLARPDAVAAIRGMTAKTLAFSDAVLEIEIWLRAHPSRQQQRELPTPPPSAGLAPLAYPAMMEWEPSPAPATTLEYQPLLSALAPAPVLPSALVGDAGLATRVNPEIMAWEPTSLQAAGPEPGPPTASEHQPLSSPLAPVPLPGSTSAAQADAIMTGDEGAATSDEEAMSRLQLSYRDPESPGQMAPEGGASALDLASEARALQVLA